MRGSHTPLKMQKIPLKRIQKKILTNIHGNLLTLYNFLIIFLVLVSIFQLILVLMISAIDNHIVQVRFQYAHGTFAIFLIIASHIAIIIYTNIIIRFLNEIIVHINGEFIIVRWHYTSIINIFINRFNCLYFIIVIKIIIFLFVCLFRLICQVNIRF